MRRADLQACRRYPGPGNESIATNALVDTQDPRAGDALELQPRCRTLTGLGALGEQGDSGDRVAHLHLARRTREGMATRHRASGDPGSAPPSPW